MALITSASGNLSRQNLALPTGTQLSSNQLQADATTHAFSSQVTSAEGVAGMLAGGVVGRGVRALSFASLGSVLGASSLAFQSARAGSWLLGLAGESAAFTGVGRSLHGQGFAGFGQDWLHSSISLGSLKLAGLGSAGQNILVQRTVNSSAMVAANQIAAAVGIIDHPHEALSAQFAQALVMDVQSSFTRSLIDIGLPTLTHFERSLDAHYAREQITRAHLVENTTTPVGAPVIDRALRSLPRIASIGSAFGAAFLQAVTGRAQGLHGVTERIQSFTALEGLGIGAKLIAGIGLGFLLPVLRTKYAFPIAGLVTTGLLARPHQNAWEWAGDLALLGIMGLYGKSRYKALVRDSATDPFKTAIETRIPQLIPTPENLVSSAVRDTAVEGTYFERLSERNAEDGLPEHFIWRLEPTRGLSDFQHFFFGAFDPVRTSTGLGRLTRTRFSGLFVPMFARAKNINLDRFVGERGPDAPYRTFNEFFTRRLRDIGTFFEGAAPDEAKVVYMARLSRNNLDHEIIIKGQRISVRALLGDEMAARLPENVIVTINYLAPQDYHRAHTAIGGRILQNRRIRGNAWTVQPEIWNEADTDGRPGAQYLTFNDRWILGRDTRYGTMATAYIAALNVFSTTTHGQEGEVVPTAHNELIYNLGSTNVHFVDAAQFLIASSLTPGNQLCFGQTPFLIPRAQVRR